MLCLRGAACAAAPAKNRELARAVKSGRSAQPTFYCVAALVFMASEAATLLGCASMATMDGMPMAGGWTLSMVWTSLCGQTWLGAAVAFLGMWGAMMVAMMLPSVLPALWHFRNAAALSEAAWPGALALAAGAAYFLVWTLLGLLVFLAGTELAAIALRRPDVARAIPVLAGLVVLSAGVFQLTSLKSDLLASCRGAPDPGFLACARLAFARLACARLACARLATACGWGIGLGLRCCLSCAGLIAVLLVVGVMDLGAMVVVTAAITLERLAPVGLRIAEAIGCVTAGAGVILITRAVGFA